MTIRLSNSKTPSPLVSIIVPIYNTSQYLVKCIDSIIDQTLQDIEIILVDDGSTDSSVEICDRYESLDSRIRVIHKANGGLCAARRTGIEASQAEYVGFVDSDDWVDPDMYSVLYERLIKEEADIITSGFIRDEDGDRYNDTAAPGIYTGEKKEQLCNKLIYDKAMQDAGVLLTVCTKLYRKDLILNHMQSIPSDLVRYEDLAYTYPPFMDAGKVIITHDSFYHYRITPGSMSTAYDPLEYEKMTYSLSYSRDVYSKYGDECLHSFTLFACFCYHMYLYRMVNGVRVSEVTKQEKNEKIKMIANDMRFQTIVKDEIVFISDKTEKSALSALLSMNPRKSYDIYKHAYLRKKTRNRIVTTIRRVLGDKTINRIKAIIRR
ncbi:MAG: glycosyltransferase [Lachnospiraceae bacterium]|nr:glycosyltransferase [Lachnospiraceae bacterium]